MDCDLERLHDFRAVIVELAVPVRPHVQGIDGLAYGHRPLGARAQRHAHWVRPAELRVETSRTGTGRSGCLRRREVEAHGLIVRRAAAVVLVLERTRAAGHADGDAKGLHAEITSQTGVSRGE